MVTERYIEYRAKNFRADTLSLIRQADSLIHQYHQDGYDLTLRQLYYQFVSMNIIPNTDRDYKRLGDIINAGRMAGMIPWNRIVDRQRKVRENAHWECLGDLLESARESFALDKWVGQSNRVEVWIEKDALVGVIERPCRSWDVPFFSCRGYASQTAMWDASQRILGYIKNGQTPSILHLGDHDPSGIHMTEDIRNRLSLFCGRDIEVRRIALTQSQIKATGLAPNPAKMSDPRAKKYLDLFGPMSWELDALTPQLLENLVSTEIESLCDLQWRDDLLAEESLSKSKVRLFEDHLYEGFEHLIKKYPDEYRDLVEADDD